MDAVSYSLASKQAQRIEKFIENPDSNSGIVTVPKVIASTETITIPAGRVAILPNVQIDGVLNVENGGEVFIPSGSTLSSVVEKVTSTDNAIVRFDGTTGKVQNSAITIDDSGNIGSGIQSFNGFGGSGFKNLLINPNFLVNQRVYVSGTNTTVANQYAHDRWRVVTSGQNVTFTKTNNMVTVTAPAGSYEQIIEDINVQSGDYKISHEGTATIAIAESADNVTYTILSPNANGTYTLTGGKYVRVRFSSGTIIKPQVELGSVRTPFENRPYGLELSLCQRYWHTGNAYWAGYAYGSARAGTKTAFPADMRTIPSVIITVNNGLSGFSSVDINYLGLNTKGVTFDKIANTTLLDGRWYIEYIASAEL